MDINTTNTIVNYFQHLYSEADEMISLFKPVCKRGCPWCCYQSVEILNWEEPLICQYISEKIDGERKEDIRKNLENWFEFFERVTKGKTELTMHDAFSLIHKRQGQERIPCPFLTNKECSIYEVRPLSCRCHIATTNSDECKRNPFLDSTPESIFYRREVISEIIRNIPTTLRLLAYTAAPFFNLGHRIKPIEYTQLKPIESHEFSADKIKPIKRLY
jgi:Fe-S-cluster containining protein